MEKIPIIKHIEELRKRTIQYLVLLFILVIISFIFIKQILSVLLGLIDIPLVFISPQEGFLITIKLSVLVGFLLSLPFLLFQIWGFISHALTKEEKKKLGLYLPLSFILFAAGIALAYTTVVPLGLNFLVNYGQQFFQPMISIKEYISFITVIFLIFGLAFQIPLIIVFFNSIGLINKRQLNEKRNYFYLASFIIGAFFTPPDAVTQICLAVPIIILYEISYVVVAFKGRKE